MLRLTLQLSFKQLHWGFCLLFCFSGGCIGGFGFVSLVPFISRLTAHLSRCLEGQADLKAAVWRQRLHVLKFHMPTGIHSAPEDDGVGKAHWDEQHLNQLVISARLLHGSPGGNALHKISARLLTDYK